MSESRDPGDDMMTKAQLLEEVERLRERVALLEENQRAEEDRRRFDAQMQNTHKLRSLGVMAGGIAHDFNNILFAILWNADLGLDATPPEAPGHKHLHEIKQAAWRASELTEQMLAFSGRRALTTERLDLTGLVKEMTHLLRASPTKRTIFEYRLKEHLPAIEGDPSELRQVVTHLITNASEAEGDEGGVTTLTTDVIEATPEYLGSTYLHDNLPAGRYVYLEVTDNGCGMDEAVRSQICEPFFTTKFMGRGLGMAAVLGIVRAHYGAIDIHSEVGRGTTVRVLLPALDESAEPPSKTVRQEKAWTAHGTVLVVDDESQVRDVLALVLERKGFTVLTAEDGRQAIEVFRKHTDEIVCVLLDFTMPHMSGEETFVELREICSDVPVVLVSGHSEGRLRESVETLGFDGFLQKPLGSRALLEEVRRVMGD